MKSAPGPMPDVRFLLARAEAAGGCGAVGRGELCPLPAVARVAGRCTCGHGGEWLACEAHRPANFTRAECNTCAEDHNCPVTFWEVS